MAALIFLSVDAHLWLLQAVQRSFVLIPFGGVISFEPSFVLISDLVGQVFIIGIQIALPVVATILLTDIGLGIVIRAVPQINVFVLGFPIKIMVGLAVVVFALPTFVYLVSELFAADGLLFRYLEGLLALGGRARCPWPELICSYSPARKQNRPRPGAEKRRVGRAGG